MLAKNKFVPILFSMNLVRKTRFSERSCTSATWKKLEGFMAIAIKATLVLLVLFLMSIPAQSEEQWQLDVESGLVFTGYNDVRIPGDTGTLISLSDELKIDPTSFFRLRFWYRFSDRHTLGILIAPLRLEAGGEVNRVVIFQDAEFPANTHLRSQYRFDSYRLTYRWDFYRADDLQVGFGATAKVRDAAISLKGDKEKSEKTNTGFVPLMHFRCQWMLAKQLGLLLEGDALAAPQGRAEDVLLALSFWPDDKVSFKVGYRILEGGADNDEVYNFTLLNYLVVAGTVTF